MGALVSRLRERGKRSFARWGWNWLAPDLSLYPIVSGGLGYYGARRNARMPVRGATRIPESGFEHGILCVRCAGKWVFLRPRVYSPATTFPRGNPVFPSVPASFHSSVYSSRFALQLSRVFSLLCGKIAGRGKNGSSSIPRVIKN